MCQNREIPIGLVVVAAAVIVPLGTPKSAFPLLVYSTNITPIIGNSNLQIVDVSKQGWPRCLQSLSDALWTRVTYFNVIVM